MWITAVYHQVSLFSLKPSDATSTGGRSLLVPTPFSVKMALVDLALRHYGASTGAVFFPAIRDLAIAVSPPPQIVVNNTFVRIHKPRRNKGKSVAAGTSQDELADDVAEGAETNGLGHPGPFIRSVAFREYVLYNGPLGLALETRDADAAQALIGLLPMLNYLGKRGSFFQIDSPPQGLEELPARLGYIRLDTEAGTAAPTAGSVLQRMDDCTPRLSFAQADIYSGVPMKDRVVRYVTLPYRLTRSSKGFSLYERTTIST